MKGSHHFEVKGEHIRYHNMKSLRRVYDYQFLGNFSACANIRYQAAFLPPPSQPGYEAKSVHMHMYVYTLCLRCPLIYIHVHVLSRLHIYKVQTVHTGLEGPIKFRQLFTFTQLVMHTYSVHACTCTCMNREYSIAMSLILNHTDIVLLSYTALKILAQQDTAVR